MKHTFAALLHDIEISEHLGSGDKINDHLKITNDKSKISTLFTRDHRLVIGEMEASALTSGAPVVYSECELPQGMTQQEFLLTCIYEIQSFLMTTWIIQDNSINCEIGFVFYENGPAVNVSSNFVAHLYSTAEGIKTHIKLSREQLREMRCLHREALRAPEHPYKIPPSQLTSKHPRVTRAIFMVNSARGTPDIAMKVAHYCTAFETLFATTQTELAHQLSERIACYLHSEPSERLIAYRKMKQAYALRSKVVHGATVKAGKMDDAVSTAKFCDETARSIFRKVLMNPAGMELFEQNPKSFDDAMLRMIFGGNGD